MNPKRRAFYDFLSALIFLGAAARWATTQPPTTTGMVIAGVLLLLAFHFTYEGVKTWRQKK